MLPHNMLVSHQSIVTRSLWSYKKYKVARGLLKSVFEGAFQCQEAFRMRLPLPKNEDARLENLRSYRILDTPPEQAFDDLTRLAAFVCGTPIALISLIDLNRQWFKSAVGWDVREIPRDVSFCTHTILKPDLLVIPETLKDKTLGTSPLATHGGIRFYAGVPLITAEGYALGTLCVMDCIPRALTEEQADALQRLAGQVVAQLKLHQTTFSQDGLADRSEGKGADRIVGESEVLY